MTQEEKYNKIEAYLRKELSEDEQKAFEVQLGQNPLLREEVKLHQEVQETLKGNDLHDFRQVLKTVNDDWTPSEEKPTKNIRRFISSRWVALAASLIGAFLIYTFLLPEKRGAEQLFADNFQPYPMLLNERSGEAQEETLQLSQGIQAYANNNYAKAIRIFQSLQQRTTNPAYKFYLSIAYLGNQEADKAIPILEEINDDSANIFNEQSKWYLALAYIQIKNLERAKSLLASIPQGSYQYQAAQDLLKKL